MDKKFTYGKMSARKQFHVIRRLAPAIADFAPLFKLITKDVKSMESEDREDLGIKAIETLGVGLSKLKDEDADFIIDSFLDITSIDLGQGTGFAPLRTNGVLMYHDLTMQDELKIVFGGIKANFQDFIPAIRSALHPLQSEQKTV